jgi:transposase
MASANIELPFRQVTFSLDSHQVMIDFHLFHQIHDLHFRQQLSFSEIGRLLSLDLRTVSKWANTKRYTPRKVKTSNIDPYKTAVIHEFALAQTTALRIFKNLEIHGYKGGYASVKRFVAKLKTGNKDTKIILNGKWMHMLLQGKITASNLVIDLDEKLSLENAETLIKRGCEERLKERNRAITIIAHLKGISNTEIAKFLMINSRTVNNIIFHYQKNGIHGPFTLREGLPRKYELIEYENALFAILHSPPSDYGINRTSWVMQDLNKIMREQGLPISRENIRKIIRKAGFRFRKAKKVLTSTDPNYREKLKSITRILANLTETECFFSIDEFGPFAVKMQGGKALAGPDDQRVVPQWQKSKGSLILTGALELSTNQITHFYSDNKNTSEMITLLKILLTQYKEKTRIYFSWDAASWHASKELEKEVERVNSQVYRTNNGTPEVVLAPLPACAQFLNVIESVFSGMARAIIHNSDYQTVNECKSAINRYFSERNENFKIHPKRAGNKIWGKERVKAVFSESNNCKDPIY